MHANAGGATTTRYENSFSGCSMMHHEEALKYITKLKYSVISILSKFQTNVGPFIQVFGVFQYFNSELLQMSSDLEPLNSSRTHKIHINWKNLSYVLQVY